MLSRDPLPSSGTMFALLQNEESRRDTMVESIIPVMSQDRFAFAITNLVGMGWMVAVVLEVLAAAAAAAVMMDHLGS